MKIHLTNYFNIYIEFAEDTEEDYAIKSPITANKTVVKMRHELIVKTPNKYTSNYYYF